jgi:protein gp37
MARLHNNSEFPKGWDGHVRLFPDRLKQLLHWRKPRRIAVGLMGDLFHDDVPDEFIDNVFGVMGWHSRHIFQILTKRPSRMLQYCLGLAGLTRQQRGVRMARSKGFTMPDDTPGGMDWPLSNIWLGVSCENQETAYERIPLLLQTPATVRFVSCEPLLGSIDLEWALIKYHIDHPFKIKTGLDWVIAGGESGPGARPMHPEWPRYLKDRCQAVGIPYHFKQWGEWAHLDWRHEMPAKGDKWVWCDGTSHAIVGHEMPSTMHGCVLMRRVGKKTTGRLLDGREWLEFPNA